jgi:hypothetical protein
MINDLRGTFFLFVAFICFLFIIGVLVLGSLMRPRRWSERQRVAA